MLSLLKKKSEAAAAPVAPSWHPNFRNYEKLPDIKVVRTAFFVNVGAVSAALAMGLYFGANEWELRHLNSQIAEQVSFTKRDKLTSDKAAADFKKFQAEEAKINEVDAFMKARPKLSTLIAHIGATLPENIALDSFDLLANGLTLRLSVKGGLEVASGRANDYKGQLVADKELSYFNEAQLISLSPNPATGRVSVDILLPAKPVTPPKK